MKADFARCSGIFRLRGGSSRSEDSLKVAIPDKHVLTPDGAHRIGVDFARDCQGSVDTFRLIKQLIEARYPGLEVGIRLDIGSGSVAIPIDSNRKLMLFSSAESLRIPDWIEVVRADGFRFCPNLRKVIVGLQREIGGFCDCPQLEHVELSRSVEVIEREAFRAGKGECHVFIAGDESWLWRRWRRYHVFITRRSAQKEEKRQIALSGVISHLTAKFGGNVHDRGVVEVTASSFSGTFHPWKCRRPRKEFAVLLEDRIGPVDLP
jgi:hypothetical protein